MNNATAQQFVAESAYAFRNTPLNGIHPHAQSAAGATKAAAAQDEFWEMYDYLFEHQKALDHSHLLEYAQKIGLDIEIQK